VSRNHRLAKRKCHELRPPIVTSDDNRWPLSFPCVVTQLNGDPPPLARCRTWIQGRDLGELGAAAAQELGASTDCCEFTMVEPDNAPGRMFLEVLCVDAAALVGPMAGPKTPASLSTSARYVLEHLIELLGLSDGVTGPAGAAARPYVVTVRYASMWGEVAYPPPRLQNESNESYQARCAAVESFLIDRASQQGFFALQYSVPPCDWTAGDLASVIDLAYGHLPTNEPASRESGWISWRPNGRMPGCCTVTVARSDYTASLRLPSFPRDALTDWLFASRCVIDLYQPLTTRWHSGAVSSAAAICSSMPVLPHREVQ
jgi:hypothetical protein